MCNDMAALDLMGGICSDDSCIMTKTRDVTGPGAPYVPIHPIFGATMHAFQIV